MCSSFNTAFYDGEGLLVQSRKRIAWRHIKTWFIVDVLTLGPEWFEMIYTVFFGNLFDGTGELTIHSKSEGFDLFRVLRGGRFFRLLRLLRLLRIAKTQKIAGSLFGLTEDFAEWVALLISMGQIQLGFLIYMHYLTCLWHFLGSSEDLESTWRIEFVQNGPGQFDNSVLTRYLISLQWALSTVTPNNTELVAQNQRERGLWCSAQNHFGGRGSGLDR